MADYNEYAAGIVSTGWGVDTAAKEFGNRIREAVTGQRPSAIAPVERTSSRSFEKEIEEAERSGRTSPLPSGSPCISDSSLTDGFVRYEVKNSTPYDPRVIMSGPSEHEVHVAPNSSQAATLPAATYKILGRVNSPSVLPFLGTRVLPSGNICGSEFYIDQR